MIQSWYANELRRILQRLEKSDTPRKRSNALDAYRIFLRNLEDFVAIKFPRMRDDGSAIVPVTPKGYFCHLCSMPFPDVRRFARHIIVKHRPSVGDPRCICGVKWFWSYAGLSRTLISHLARAPHDAVTIHAAALARADQPR